MEHKLKNVKKQTNNKFLNLYEANFEEGVKWTFASRRTQSELEILGKENVDAVRVVPYFKKRGKIYVVLIREFRYPINKFIYEVPAGLVENENPESTAKREVSEEIGAEVVSLQELCSPAYASAGLSDEKIAIFEAEVRLCEKQKLEKGEDIEIELVELSDLPKLFQNHDFCLQSLLALEVFYFKHLNDKK